MSAAFEPVRMLETLARHQVEHVVIGGFAAWVHGAPIVTADLDLIFANTPENIARLVRALTELGAVYRDPLDRHIEPTQTKLASTSGAGHHLFKTTAGDLDVLRDSGGLGFAELVPSSVIFEIDGIKIRFASLERIIEMKQRAGRPKDMMALPILRAVLEQSG